jgi:flap endonuclease-1
MGVAIGKLIEESKQKFEFNHTHKHKKFGFDAYNILYQFLTTIRGVDGEPLKNENGDITSHLNGLFYRMLNILSNDVDVFFVYDGKSIDLKQKTQDERRSRKEIAKEHFKDAVLRGDLEDMNKFSKRITSIDDKIIQESKDLLKAMGISIIDAPSEAEAQISYMTKENLLDFTVSQDFDCLLFGSPNLVRNLTVSRKKKIPSKNIYVDINPEIIYLKETLEKLNLSREKLIYLSMLIGTDFNDKVEGVGPKTALKLVLENNSFESIEKSLKEKNKVVNFDYKEIENIFLNPLISKNPEISKSEFDRNKIENILIDRFNFSQERVVNSLDKFITARNNSNKQKTIDKWF